MYDVRCTFCTMYIVPCTRYDVYSYEINRTSTKGTMYIHSANCARMCKTDTIANTCMRYIVHRRATIAVRCRLALLSQYAVHSTSYKVAASPTMYEYKVPLWYIVQGTSYIVPCTRYMYKELCSPTMYDVLCTRVHSRARATMWYGVAHYLVPSLHACTSYEYDVHTRE